MSIIRVILILLVFLTAVGARAQTTNSAGTQAPALAALHQAATAPNDSATADVGPNSCHCYGVISYSDLTNANTRRDVCFDFGELATYGTLINCSKNQSNKNDCQKRVADATAALTAAQRQSIAQCLCDHGVPSGSTIRAYAAVGTENYGAAATFRTYVNTAEVTNTVCKCPPGWLANATNVDGGVTVDGKCKRGVCGPWSTATFPPPPNGTPVGTWGFTWGNGLYAWGTAANGGRAKCVTTMVSPSVCKLEL